MTKSSVLVVALAMILGFGVGIGLFIKRWNHLLAVVNTPEEELVFVPNDWNFWTLEISNLAEELRVEKEGLALRKSELETLEKRLQSEKAELFRVREQIDSIRDEINKSIITLLDVEKPNLKSLSRSYSAMKPAEAASILMNLSDDMVVKLLSLMKPNIVAALLTQMASPPEGGPEAKAKGSARAGKITEKLRLLKDETSKEKAP